MTLKAHMYQALISYYQGQYEKSSANLAVYMSNPAGIGEHSGIIEAMDFEIGKMAEAAERLNIINEWYDDWLGHDNT